MNHRRFPLVIVALLWLAANSAAQVTNPKYQQEDAFRQLEEVLPTPNGFRTASGAPGREYWQQRADYVIDVELDDVKQHLTGRETITYFNNSPDTLTYLWLQLDPNIFDPNSAAAKTETSPDFDEFPFETLYRLMLREKFKGGVNITEVSDERGGKLAYRIVGTMMRVDLPTGLAPQGAVKFNVAWDYAINDAKNIGGRTGYEYFEEDKNYIYEMAQWFPRMCAYTDVTGWQHKQYLGTGEFTLELGDYLVRITVPNDHITPATGVLQNPAEVLTDAQRERLKQADAAKTPMFVVTPEEAKANEADPPTGKKTWVYHAQNVRDFAFASSRKFIWDAQGHDVEGNRVMAMSFYPNEGEPLWSKYSTHSIIHTLNVYSRYTFPYPYPIAISVNGPVGGMEYPMICFNGPRPEKDGTYSERTKYGLISVIIHEVGHSYFPMIVNNDEREWMWMDEGINTFLQYLSEQEWEEKYPSRRGEPKDIVGYMLSREQVPIMTGSDSLLQVGNAAYAKPATALNILRETILGRELFDYSFKEYARRWRFKRPMPADLFRTMEDASGTDLDWFWRGWFYTTDHVDIAISRVRQFEMDTANPEIDGERLKKDRAEEPVTKAEERNKPLRKRVDQFPELKDFYNSFDELDVTPDDREKFQKYMETLEQHEKDLLEIRRNFYAVELKNVGGVVMPVIFRIDYEDGSTEELRIPAEIWRHNNQRVTKLFWTEKSIKSLTLDPHLETADADEENNYWPSRPVKSRFQLFKEKEKRNAMQKAQGKPEVEAEEESQDEPK